MTIYRPKIRGGPAGDVGLGKLAAVIRYGYGAGYLKVEGDEEAQLEAFGAFLAGVDRPPSSP